MVHHIPELLPRVHKANIDEPRIARKSLKEQFDQLIFQPLTDLNPTRPTSSIIFVIDALDECEQEGDVRSILSLLANTRRLGSVHIRVFLTSRPELPIRLGFAQMGTAAHREIDRHDIISSTIHDDIYRYLDIEFTRIQDEHNCIWPADQSLASSWPGRVALQTLAQRAVPLFLAAATICRFVGDRCGDPSDRLATVLRYQTNFIGQMSDLERTYLPVLSQLIAGAEEGHEKDKVCRDFREIVGSIVLLAHPLSMFPLAKLLNITKHKLDHQLHLLHSVLSILSNPNAPVQLFQPSFRDFLIQKQKDQQGGFGIDQAAVHRYLAERCLALLQGPDGLRKNICRLTHSGVRRWDIDQEIMDLYIPQHLRYACRYWDVQHSGWRFRDDHDIDLFLRQHFLHWIESLSPSGKITESVSILNTLQSLVAIEDSCISAFLQDAWRFVLIFNAILAQAPLQAYCAAWHFSPLKSIFRSTSQDQASQTIRTTSGVLEQWNSCLLTYEGHSGRVISVVFSPAGSRVASGSYDNTVRVWDVQTGQYEHMLQGHSGTVTSVVFSPGGSRVASGSHDSTVLIGSLYLLRGSCGFLTNIDLRPGQAKGI